MNHHFKGYVLGIVAAAAYGMNPLFALPCYAGGMNPDSVLLFRYLLALPLLGAMLQLRGHSFKISGKEAGLLGLFGIMMAFSSLALFISYNYMAAGIASTILFVYPIMVALLMACVFHERLNALTVIALLMATAGIGLLYKNEDGGTLSLAGTILVMLSSLSYAIYIVSVSRTRLKDVPTLKVTFYILLFGSVLFVARISTTSQLTMPALDQWHLWLNLAALAAVPTALSFMCTTSAIKYIGSTTTAILGAFEPVTAIVFGVTVFGEQLSRRDIGGIAMIIIAVSIVVASGSITHQLIRLKRLFPKAKKKS